MPRLLDVMPVGDIGLGCCVGAFALGIAGLMLVFMLHAMREQRGVSRALEAWAGKHGLARRPTPLAGGDRFVGTIGGIRVAVASADVLRAGNSSSVSEISFHAYGAQHQRSLVLGPRAIRDEQEMTDGLTPITVAAFEPTSQLTVFASSPAAPTWLDVAAIRSLREPLKLVGTWSDEAEVRLGDRIHPEDVLDRALALALAIARTPSDVPAK